MARFSKLLLLSLLLSWPALGQTFEEKLLKGARSCLGDVYDAGYYGGGPPPKGRGACPEVVYYAMKAVNLDLQNLVDKDIIATPGSYPNVRDRNIDYRWCPNLIVWFKRHSQTLPLNGDWKAGDIVLWSLLDDGVADHIGIVSDKKAGNVPLVIHNVGPRCSEDRSLHSWTIVGHFRLKKS